MNQKAQNDNEKDEPHKLLSISSMLIGRQGRGPTLIALGCLLLYILASNTPASSTVSPLIYGLAILLGIIVVAGIIITFREIQSNEVSNVETLLPVSTSDLEHAITQLSKNYELLRRQCTQGFILAAVFMTLGIIVILSGSIGTLFGLATGGSSLASVAGILTEFISATALHLYNTNFKKLNATSDELNHTWKILAAFRQAEKLPEQEKTQVTVSLIETLVKT